VQLINNLISSRSAYTDPRPFTWLPSQNTANTWLTYATTGQSTAFSPVITSPKTISVTLGNTLKYQITASNSPTSFNATGLPLGLTVNTTTGIITGIPLALGTASITISATNAVGTTSGSLTLSVSTGSTQTFAQWATSFGVSSNPSATPENDGVSDLMKYLCDINPTVPLTPAARAALPTLGDATVNGVDYVTLTYRQYQNETGITVTLESSPDLINWSPVVPPPLSQQLGVDPVTKDPIMQVGVTAATSGNQFLRLKITDPLTE
jgi:hypothetical protein